jgi:hypothetical protein
VPPSDDSSTVKPVNTDAVPKLVGAVHDTVKLVLVNDEADTPVGADGTVEVVPVVKVVTWDLDFKDDRRVNTLSTECRAQGMTMEKTC